MSLVLVRKRLLHLCVLAVCACSLPGPASAAATLRLIAPAGGSALPLGIPPTFVLENGRQDIAMLEVSASSQADANGVFPAPEWSTAYESRTGRRNITVTPQRSSSRGRFWNKPGTYYWHA